jgi:hypothetical protein
LELRIRESEDFERAKEYRKFGKRLSLRGTEEK